MTHPPARNKMTQRSVNSKRKSEHEEKSEDKVERERERSNSEKCIRLCGDPSQLAFLKKPAPSGAAARGADDYGDWTTCDTWRYFLPPFSSPFCPILSSTLYIGNAKRRRLNFLFLFDLKFVDVNRRPVDEASSAVGGAAFQVFAAPSFSFSYPSCILFCFPVPLWRNRKVLEWKGSTLVSFFC